MKIIMIIIDEEWGRRKGKEIMVKSESLLVYSVLLDIGESYFQSQLKIGKVINN
jgi:hypothetical protein